MGRHRTITTAALAALALSVPISAAHASSTLLSGYGGPGQGNQALIGSSLIGGGGKTGGGGAGSSEASSSSSSASPTGSSLALSQPRRVTKRTPARHASKHAVSGTSTRPAPTSPAVRLAAQRSAGGTLGLSGADAAYIAIAFAVLALTAVLTSRFARRAGRAGRAQ
jgi:hypothetical protein